MKTRTWRQGDESEHAQTSQPEPCPGVKDVVVQLKDNSVRLADHGWLVCACVDDSYVLQSQS